MVRMMIKKKKNYWQQRDKINMKYRPIERYDSYKWINSGFEVVVNADFIFSFSFQMFNNICLLFWQMIRNKKEIWMVAGECDV